MVWWHNRYWYIPVAIVIGLGYCLGGYYWYAFTYLNYAPQIAEPEARYFIQLYCLGLVGGSMHCSIFFARDFNQKVYGSERLPTFLDFAGYGLQIIGGGITGIVLFLAFKVGLVVLLTGGNEQAKVSDYAAWLIAFAGGFSTHIVKRFIATFVADSLKNENNGAAKDT